MDNCNDTDNETRKASYDPGWNDPPKFAYNGKQTTPNRPRNFLNKRVAFPLASTGSSTAAPPVNLPPMPSILTATPPAHMVEKSDVYENINIDSESVLSEVRNILLSFLDNSSELGSKGDDIRRRINVMSDMWSSGKLNKNIHCQMKELACALRDEHPHRADDIHRALMVDHVSAVGTWMPGVKQLIHHCIARCELLSIDKE